MTGARRTMTRSHWIDVGAAAELLSAAHLSSEVDGCAITIVRVADSLYAFEDRCTHDGEPLTDAEIDPNDAAGPVVICPRHGARFCLRDGAALTPPAYEPVRVFPVREADGRILVDAA